MTAILEPELLRGPDLSGVPAQLAAILDGGPTPISHLWMIKHPSESVPEDELVLGIPSGQIKRLGHGLAPLLHTRRPLEPAAADIGRGLARTATKNHGRLIGWLAEPFSEPGWYVFDDGRQVDLEVAAYWDSDWRRAARALSEWRGRPPILGSRFGEWIAESLEQGRLRAGREDPSDDLGLR
ncbi:MAG TPA: hypothetical protein VIA06_08580 [Candidatus Dormibacteraeota bacterium]|jgi:hypothetical protein|nr:hypothetical protein [Candidatus Dormibacteraeota bacterium]